MDHPTTTVPIVRNCYNTTTIFDGKQYVLLEDYQKIMNSLVELIPIAEFTLDYYINYKSKNKQETVQAAIENARKLIKL